MEPLIVIALLPFAVIVCILFGRALGRALTPRLPDPRSDAELLADDWREIEDDFNTVLKGK